MQRLARSYPGLQILGAVDELVTPLLAFGKLHLQCRNHGKCDIVLKGERVLILTIIAIGPDLLAGKGIDKPCRDTQGPE